MTFELLLLFYGPSAPLQRYANNCATSSGRESQPEYQKKRSRKRAQFTFDAVASQSFKGGKKHFWATARLDCEHKEDKCSRDEWANRFDRINKKKRRKNQMIFTVCDFTFYSVSSSNLLSLSNENVIAQTYFLL